MNRSSITEESEKSVGLGPNFFAMLLGLTGGAQAFGVGTRREAFRQLRDMRKGQELRGISCPGKGFLESLKGNIRTVARKPLKFHTDIFSKGLKKVPLGIGAGLLVETEPER
jgi:hypothetical protein